MNNEVLGIIEQLCREKGIDKEILVEALKSAMEAAARKKLETDCVLQTEFNAETEAVKFARRSIVSKFDIPKGTKITENMIDVKRPGTGISPKYFFKIIGSKTLKNIQEDSTIQWDDIDFSQ